MLPQLESCSGVSQYRSNSGRTIRPRGHLTEREVLYADRTRTASTEFGNVTGHDRQYVSAIEQSHFNNARHQDGLLIRGKGRAEVGGGNLRVKYVEPIVELLLIREPRDAECLTFVRIGDARQIVVGTLT